MKQIQEIVQQLGQQYGFTTVVLTDTSGVPLAASSGGAAAEAPAAIVALIRRVAEQARDRLGLGAMDEMTMYDEHGQRLVCRRFVAGRHDLILAAVVPPQAAYRRATNQAIRQIRQAWTFK